MFHDFNVALSAYMMRNTIAKSAALLLVAVAGCREDPAGSASRHTIEAPSAATVSAGDTTRLAIIVMSEAGKAVHDVALQFLSQDTGVVRVDSAGLLYGVAPGTSEVSVSAGLARAAVVVTVNRVEGGWAAVHEDCGVWNTGSIYCWMWADGSIAQPVPLQGPGLSVTTRGKGHRCGLTPTGQAYCWGSNRFGQLGDGSTTDQASPTRVNTEVLFKSISVGPLHTCGLAQDGRAWCWGADQTGQLGVGFASAVCGSGRCAVLPTEVSGGRRFLAVSAGGEDRVEFGAVGRGFTCALDESHKAYCWGHNEFGALGDSSKINRELPTPVSGGHEFRMLAAGGAHTCAIDRTGVLYCWGLGGSGQLGVPVSAEFPPTCYAADIAFPCSSTPLKVSPDERWRVVTASLATTCGINSFGAALCWGSNRFGEVGDGKPINPGGLGNVFLPSRVVGGLTFTNITAFTSAVCGRASDANIYCWGLGSSTPMKVPDPH